MVSQKCAVLLGHPVHLYLIVVPDTGAVIFWLAGIQVRHNEPLHLMHHKFLVIDNRILITGSFNWSRQAIVGNNENLIVTTHPKLVPVYRSEFQKLWSMFDPQQKVSSINGV